MRLSDIGLALCIAFGLSAVASARIINVPQNQRTIQRGINAAQAGDTVLVQPGMYNENLRITEPITLAGLTLLDNDPAWIDSTIVEAADSACVITISGDEGVVHLRGITIQGGYSVNWGGGIIGGGRSAILEDLVICENFTGRSGGGLYWGGACDSFICRRVRIYGNRATAGGGVCLWSATNTSLYDCSITDNDGGQYGALLSHASDVIMKNVLIANNRTSSDRWSMALTSCEEREATISFDQVTVVNNVLSQGGSPANDILINSAGGNPMDATLRNCIFNGDNDNQPIHVFAQGAIRFDAAYCDLEGGREGFQIGDGVESIIGDGNIDSDPLFVDPDNGDFHLSENSPCIDAGDPNSPHDPDGTRADMGAFYFAHFLPPEVAGQIADVTVAEDCGLVAISDLDTVFSDPNGDTLMYRVYGLDVLGLAVDAEGLLSLEPALNFNGDSITVVVSAFDASDSASVSFFVTVTPVNDLQSPFGLLTPEDGSILYHIDGRYIPFSWERSFDPDSIDALYYNIRALFTIPIMIEPGHWEAFDTLIINEDLDDTTYTFDTWPFIESFRIYFTDIVWLVSAISQNDTIWCDTSFNLHFQIETIVREGENMLTKFYLDSPYPNPFNSSTTIRFGLSKLAPTRIGIYGLDGRLVQELWTGRDAYPPGEHSVIWNANGLPGGVYLLALESGGERMVRKVVLLR